MKKESPLYTVIFAFVVSAAFALLLGAVNAATRETIQLKQKLVKERAILEAASVPFEGLSDVEVDKLFNERVRSLDYMQKHVYVIQTPEGPVFAFEYSGPGLWGTIYTVIAIDDSLTRLVGVSFTKQSETPGLGGRIDEAWFKAQFRGEKLRGTEPFIRVRKSSRTSGDPDHENASVDAITGATLTSSAVEKLINRGLGEYLPVLRELKASDVL